MLSTKPQSSGGPAPISHFDDPIPDDGKLHGHSRRAGDASPEVKQAVVECLIRECEAKGLDARDTAHVLAIAHIESGFNPDAAARTTSASGIGQFIRATGSEYGLGGDNRFDMHANAKALVAHFVDNKELAQERGKSEAWVYKFHHDGPAGNYGGLELAHSHVMPYLDQYLSVFEKSGDLGDAAKKIAHDHSRPTAKLFAEEQAWAARGQDASASPAAEAGTPAVSFDELMAKADKMSVQDLESLREFLADHMRSGGFDSKSVAQAAVLCELIAEHAQTRPSEHDTLVLHKSGDALASVMPAQAAQEYAKQGDSVLSLPALEHLAQAGRGAPEQAAASPDHAADRHAAHDSAPEPSMA